MQPTSLRKQKVRPVSFLTHCCGLRSWAPTPHFSTHISVCWNSSVRVDRTNLLTILLHKGSIIVTNTLEQLKTVYVTQKSENKIKPKLWARLGSAAGMLSLVGLFPYWLVQSRWSSIKVRETQRWEENVILLKTAVFKWHSKCTGTGSVLLRLTQAGRKEKFKVGIQGMTSSEMWQNAEKGAPAEINGFVSCVLLFFNKVKLSFKVRFS